MCRPAAASTCDGGAALEAQGCGAEEAAQRAGYRIFGSKPGAYGAGLQTPIDEGVWEDEGDLAGEDEPVLLAPHALDLGVALAPP